MRGSHALFLAIPMSTRAGNLLGGAYTAHRCRWIVLAKHIHHQRHAHHQRRSYNARPTALPNFDYQYLLWISLPCYDYPYQTALPCLSRCDCQHLDSDKAVLPTHAPPAPKCSQPRQALPLSSVTPGVCGIPGLPRFPRLPSPPSRSSGTLCEARTVARCTLRALCCMAAWLHVVCWTRAWIQPAQSFTAYTTGASTVMI